MNMLLSVVCLGILVEFGFSEGWAGTPGATAHDTEGNAYRLINIGGKQWFAENLRATRSANGEPLASSMPNQDSTTVAQYGLLYDWPTARIACPAGFHLPSDEEWTQFERAVAEIGDYQFGHRDFGSDPAANKGSVSGFQILPAGYANDAGLDNQFGARAVFWSASADGDEYAWARSWRLGSTQIARASQHPHYGFSVRCVADFE